jgi:adenosylmethionine-8-amino-7-oxononanoate aminotransferase
VGAERVAAFICEPVVGASLGAVPAVDGYLKEIRRICDERDVLLILDEVMCGSGRCGTYFAWEHDAARPDIVTLGKGISAGYQPLAATVCSATVADTLTRAGFSHGFTYVGHATACAAGCAVQNVIDRDRLIDRIRERGAACLEHLKSRFGTHPNVGDVRGRGLLLALELVRDRASKAGFTAPVAESLRRAAQQAGLICYPGEALVDDRLVPHVLLAPPVLVTDAHMSEACDILESVLASQLPPS